MVAKTTTKYEADSGLIHALILDPARFAQAGAPPTANIDSNIKAKVSKSNREFGIRPRGVRLARIVGVAPDTFRKYAFLPVLTPTAYNGTGFTVGSTVTIDGTAWEVVAKVPEDY